jgi:hypothetical protein
VTISLNHPGRTIMGQILNPKPILVFDHISENEAKRVFFHHLIKPILVKRGKLRREEQAVGGILSKYGDPPHLEHPLHGRRVFDGSGPGGFNLFGEGSDFFL